MGRLSESLSSIPGVALAVVMIWGETGGIYHGWKHHQDGCLVLFLPPLAWYRGLEFFWHKDAPLPSSWNKEVPIITPPSSNPDAKAEPMSLEEAGRVTDQILSKANQADLSPLDLSIFQDAIERGEKGRKGYREAVGRILLKARINLDDQAEWTDCLEASCKQRKPVISPKLKDRLDKLRLASPASADAEVAAINSAANGGNWKGETGETFKPMSLQEVQEMREVTNKIRQNIAKLENLLHGEAHQ